MKSAFLKEHNDRIEKLSKYPVVLEVSWKYERNHFVLDHPQFTPYPHEQEVILIDGCYFKVKDIQEVNKLRDEPLKLVKRMKVSAKEVVREFRAIIEEGNGEELWKQVEKA